MKLSAVAGDFSFGTARLVQRLATWKSSSGNISDENVILPNALLHAALPRFTKQYLSWLSKNIQSLSNLRASGPTHGHSHLYPVFQQSPCQLTAVILRHVIHNLACIRKRYSTSDCGLISVNTRGLNDAQQRGLADRDISKVRATSH